MATQAVSVGQETCERAETVNPDAVPVTQVPDAMGPATMIGDEPAVVVATAAHPVPPDGHTKLESDVTFAGRVAAVQQSEPPVQPPGPDPIDPLNTTAEPLLAVPIATH